MLCTIHQHATRNPNPKTGSVDRRKTTWSTHGTWRIVYKWIPILPTTREGNGNETSCGSIRHQRCINIIPGKIQTTYTFLFTDYNIVCQAVRHNPMPILQSNAPKTRDQSEYETGCNLWTIRTWRIEPYGPQGRAISTARPSSPQPTPTLNVLWGMLHSWFGPKHSSRPYYRCFGKKSKRTPKGLPSWERVKNYFQIHNTRSTRGRFEIRWSQKCVKSLISRSLLGFGHM